MRNLFPPKATLALLILAAPAVAAAEWDFSASLEVETRLFADDAAWVGQDADQGQYSLAALAEIRWRNEAGNQRASIIPRLRWDATDPDRNLVDFGELYWAMEGRSFELLVGANTEFWGVTESVHLVDIINQTDSASDIDGEDKLGQPMVNLVLQRDWGELSLYAMPYFRERTFAGTEGRLRTPLPVDTDRPVYESSAGRDHIDLAVRYSHFFGNVDIGVSAFSGTSREPRLLPTDGVLLPYYDQIDQVGVDLQYTGDAWLWKFEGILRNGYDDSYFAAAGGFEYTFYQVRESAVDLGVLLEYQHDDRSATESATIADNDVFAGARIALNDPQDTTLLAGVGHDTSTGETFFNVEAERRLGQDYVIELRARAFANAEVGDISYAFADDSYVQVQLTRFF
jgi:hypothetical protein